MIYKAQYLFTTLLAQSDGAWDDGDYGSSASSSGGGESASALMSTLKSNLDFLNHPEQLKNLLTGMNLVWAAIFVVLGALCISSGYRWRKWILVALAGLAGMWIASQITSGAKGAQIMAASIAVITGVVAWPLMRYAASLFGGLAGAFAGANIWTAIGQPSDQNYVGAVVGLVVVGMLAFTAFRSVVIALTTIVGATMFVMGGLGALLHVEPWESGILNAIEQTPLLTPILVGSTIVVGAVLQFGGGVKGLNTMANQAHLPKGKKPVDAKAAA